MRISISFLILTIIIQIISAAKFLKEGPHGNPDKSNENKGNNHPHQSSEGKRSEEVRDSKENEGHANVKEKSHNAK